MLFNLDRTHLFLERTDEVEIVVCDVVVVVFDLREGFLVRLHEPLDVGILPFLDPGRFRFSRRVQPFPHLVLYHGNAEF